MSDLSFIIKLGALAVIAVGALWIAYKGLAVALKCAKWIYMTVIDTPPPPQAASQPVLDATEREGKVTSITQAYGRELRETGT